MPISATRIEYLDQETNTGVIDFSNITGGSLFNTGQELGNFITGGVSNLINGAIGVAKDELNNLFSSIGLSSALGAIGLSPKDLINGRLPTTIDPNILNAFIDNIIPPQLRSVIGSYSLTDQQKRDIASLALNYVGSNSSVVKGYDKCFGTGINGPYGNSQSVLDKISSTFMNVLLGNNTSLLNCLIDQYSPNSPSYSTGGSVINQITAFNTTGGKTFTVGNLVYVQIATNNWRIKNAVTGAFIDNVTYDDVYVYTKVNPTYYSNATKSIINNMVNYINTNNIQVQYRCVSSTGTFTYTPTPPDPAAGCLTVSKTYILPMIVLVNAIRQAFTDPTMPIPPTTTYYTTNNDFISYLLTSQDIILLNYDPNTIINLGG